jgi:hypothetical protein
VDYSSYYLPEGWTVKYDESTGHNYYLNTTTGESTYTMPT